MEASPPDTQSKQSSARDPVPVPVHSQHLVLRLLRAGDTVPNHCLQSFKTEYNNNIMDQK